MKNPKRIRNRKTEEATGRPVSVSPFRRFAVAWLIFCLLPAAFCVSALAQSTAFTYQGRLNTSGAPYTGMADMQFSLWTADTDGSQVGGTVSVIAIGVTNGLFTVALNLGKEFPGAERWLELAVRTNGSGAFTTLSPRQRITATPYAITAANVSGLIPESQLPQNVARLTVPNTTSQATGTVTSTSGFIIGATVTFGGSGYFTPPAVTVNAPTGSGAVITAGIAGGSVVQLIVENAGSGYTSGATITIAPPPSNGFQVFSSSNYFAMPNFLTNAGNTISGSGAGLTALNASHLTSGTVPDTQLGVNVARTNQVWLLGGNAGTITGTHFLGTSDNQPLELWVNNRRGWRLEPTVTDRNHTGIVNVVSGSAANTVGPGVFGATIGGGGAVNYGGITAGANHVDSDFGTIAGGLQNTIQPRAIYSTISGGWQHTVQSNAPYATIGGGWQHSIQSDSSYSTIGGGFFNNIQLDADHSTIGGGQQNTIQARASYSTIGGGYFNTIQTDAQFAIIPGGYMNVASNLAFAAGNRAKAIHQGAFVWGDSSLTDLASTNANSVTMRASGGYRLFSNSDATIGVRLAPSGNAWAAISDRHRKKDIQPLDTRGVLDKLAALPLSTWHYDFESPTDTPHIGPMAQDFKAAFYPGRDDKTISTMEFDGVALAAIQGLNKKLEETRAENLELKARLERLERLLNAKNGADN